MRKVQMTRYEYVLSEKVLSLESEIKELEGKLDNAVDLLELASAEPEWSTAVENFLSTIKEAKS